MVKILTVLVSTISNSQVFLLKKKCEKLLQKLKLLTFFFSENISVYINYLLTYYMPYLMIDIVSFEQLGPDYLHFYCLYISSRKLYS